MKVLRIIEDLGAEPEFLEQGEPGIQEEAKDGKEKGNKTDQSDTGG